MGFVSVPTKPTYQHPHISTSLETSHGSSGWTSRFRSSYGPIWRQQRQAPQQGPRDSKCSSQQSVGLAARDPAKNGGFNEQKNRDLYTYIYIYVYGAGSKAMILNFSLMNIHESLSYLG